MFLLSNSLEIIGILNQKCDGNIPKIEIIEARKDLAKFIGLALFKVGKECLIAKGPNCSINGPCCSTHRLEGLKEAHELFPKIFEHFGVKFDRIDAVSDTFFTSLLAVYADFKTQIIVSDVILFLSSEDGQTSLSHRLENLLEIYFGSAMHLSYLKGKLQDRAVQIRGILERGGSNKNLIESLQSKYPADLFESNLKNVMKNVYTAFPETFLTELTQGKAGNKKKVEAESASVIKESANVVPQKTTETVSSFVNSTTGSNTTKPVTPTPKPAPKTEPEPFKDVIVSGKFFRGILEPVDERFAAIIEARDVNVRQYLSQRKKRAFEGCKKATVVAANVKSSSLMERHNSAERISWETQDRSPSPISQPEINIDERNISYEFETVESLIKKRTNSVKRSSGNPRGRRRFSEQEVMNLIEGVKRFGRDWRKILANYEFDDRNNVDLKDKARNLEKLGLL